MKAIRKITQNVKLFNWEIHGEDLNGMATGVISLHAGPMNGNRSLMSNQTTMDCFGCPLKTSNNISKTLLFAIITTTFLFQILNHWNFKKMVIINLLKSKFLIQEITHFLVSWNLTGKLKKIQNILALDFNWWNF